MSPKLDQKYEEKAGDQVCFDGIDQFYKYFFFLHTISFAIGENSPAMHGWKEIVFMSPHLYFFPLKHIRLIVFLKNYH